MLVDEDKVKYPYVWYKLQHPNFGFNPSKDCQAKLQMTVQVRLAAQAAHACDCALTDMRARACACMQQASAERPRSHEEKRARVHPSLVLFYSLPVNPLPHSLFRIPFLGSPTVPAPCSRIVPMILPTHTAGDAAAQGPSRAGRLQEDGPFAPALPGAPSRARQPHLRAGKMQGLYRLLHRRVPVELPDAMHLPLHLPLHRCGTGGVCRA